MQKEMLIRPGLGAPCTVPFPRAACCVALVLQLKKYATEPERPPDRAADERWFEDDDR